MTYLTQSRAALWSALVAELEAAGFPYDPLTTTPNEYLATALGEPMAYLTKSPARMLSELVAANGGGSYSHLTMPFNQLLELAGTAVAEVGGGEEYAANGVLFPVASMLHTADTGATDAATGFFSVFVKLPVGPLVVNSVNFFSLADGACAVKIKEILDTSNGLEFEMFDEAFVNYFAIYSDTLSDIQPNTWLHMLLAWDVGHAVGQRRFAFYLNDTPVNLSSLYDEDGGAFNADYSGGAFVLDVQDNATAVADLGLWFGSSIVEANNTISEANRRKFISAAGKPVNPSNWPANPALKMTGNAAAFVVNQGSIGALTLTGTPTDAPTSPSD